MLRYICAALAICHSIFVNTQTVPSDPSFDCSNPNFQVMYTACSAGDYTDCCFVGTDCCAGGCCDVSSWCVGVGTSQETCCDINDVTRCGTGAMPKPSVVCTGSNGLSSYKCPPGATCDWRNDSCYGGDDDSEPTTTTERETPTKTKTPEPSTEADESTTTEEPRTVVVTKTAGDDSGTTTDFEVTRTRTSDDDDSTTTTTTSSASVSVSVSVVTVSTTPTTTTSSSDGWLNSVSCRLLIVAFIMSVLF